MRSCAEKRTQRQVASTLFILWARQVGKLEGEDLWAVWPPAWVLLRDPDIRAEKSPSGCGEKVGVLWGGCGWMQATVLKAASKYMETLYLEESATQTRSFLTLVLAKLTDNLPEKDKKMQYGSFSCDRDEFLHKGREGIQQTQKHVLFFLWIHGSIQ